MNDVTRILNSYSPDDPQAAELVGSDEALPEGEAYRDLLLEALSRGGMGEVRLERRRRFAQIVARDLSGAADLARWLVAEGNDGLVVAGTTGEAPTLSDNEKVELWSAVRAAVDVPILAGSGSNDTRHTIELSRRAAATGVDGLLLVSPYYNRPTQAGIEGHFRAVADATELPIVIYDVPIRTGRIMEVGTIFRLADNPRILVLDFPSLAEQGRMLNRVAALIEKAGLPRDRVLNDAELDAAIAARGETAETFYFGHNYRATDLAKFFALAARDGVALNQAERQLAVLLADTGAAPPGPDGLPKADPSVALISLSAAETRRAIGCASRRRAAAASAAPGAAERV